MEFAHSNVPASVAEFQAVILAGYGNALAPLTNDHADNSSPKSLLPIANKPMISFPLNWLDEAGVTNVLLICPHSHRSAIAHHIHSDIASSTFSTLRIDIQTYEDDDTPTLGTCSILRRFSNRILNDFVILPCDFIPPPSLPLSVVLNTYRVETEGMVISTLFYEVDDGQEKPSSDDSANYPLIAYDATSATLLHVDYSDDTEEDELELHMRLLWKYPKLRVTTRFADSHVYVCRRSVLNVLAEKPALESIREDLIPFLCKLQYRKGKRFRWEPILNESTNISSHHPPSRGSSWRSATTSRASSAPASPIFNENPKPPLSNLRCGVVVHKLAQGLAARANTIKAYTDLNRLFLKEGSPYLTPSTSTSEYIDPKAQISTDSIIGLSARLGERTVIKTSVVGQHCVIGKYVRITGSVIMDHVVIEDGAKIDGCILSQTTRIGAKAELSKSITQPGYEVDAGANLKGEKLDTADWDPRVTGDG
ncbi:nucleotide-diphospho-sugar transferase [Gautieria morchelliformis]|nr:nucleotide-diphospho-sugar transferase [Gautieria morchelliformis]